VDGGKAAAGDTEDTGCGPSGAASVQHRRSAFQSALFSGPGGYYPRPGPDLPRSEGARREYYTFDTDKWINVDHWWDMEGRHAPAIQALYALWLYGHRSNDWEDIQANWNNIKNFYQSHNGKGDLLGTVSGLIGYARMAAKFQDTDAMNAAVSRLESLLNGSLQNFETQRTTGYEYYPIGRNMTEGAIYHGGMFLWLCPSIGQFIRDYVNDPVVQHHTAGKQRYPFWWLRQGPHFYHTISDEAIGLAPVYRGALYPVERWVMDSPLQDLDIYASASPECVGDVFWMEFVTQVFEAHGTVSWIDARQDRPEVTMISDGSSQIFRPGLELMGNTLYVRGEEGTIINLLTISGKVVATFRMQTQKAAFRLSSRVLRSKGILLISFRKGEEVYYSGIIRSPLLFQ
jgi:hypothetical protein